MIITNEAEQLEFEKHLLKVYSKRTSDLSDSLTRPYGKIEELNLDSIEIIEKSAKIHVIEFESGPQLESIHWCLTALHNSFHLQQRAQDDPEAYIAHKFSSKHREQILQSKLCGCFFCLSIFTPNSIAHWIDGDKTALCPKCNIDAVIIMV